MVVQSIGLVADLRNQNKNIGVLYIATGLVTEGDNNGGVFWWNPSSTATDDGVDVIQVTGTATGRWVRITDNNNSVPSSRELTINGTTYDLSANRTWSVGTVTGTGTANYISKFTGTSSLGNSLVYDNGVNVMIGTTALHSSYSNSKFIVSGTSNTYLEVRSINNQSSIILSKGLSDTSTTPSVELFNSSNFGIVMYRPGVVGSNYIIYYNSDSVSNRYLSFQTEGSDRLTLNQNGTVRLNAYTTNGFVKSSGGNGTLTIDTTTYQPLLTNPVTGTGTPNILPKWASSSSLTNSILDDDGVSASVALASGGAFNIKYLSAIKLALTGGTTFGSIDTPVGLDFLIRPDSIEKFRISSTGLLRLANYGTGAVTGTATYRLATDASGNIIEVSDGGGTVTSVGISMPSAFNVTNSPVTGAGTLTVTGAGTTAQYIRGDGTLATFPTITSGTVTSVNMSVPTGLTISGNPITSSGTLAVGLASGYSIPTTASQATWNTAYNDSIVSAAVTGTSTKTLTLNQQDGGSVTASWSDLNTDAVTSVFGRTGAVVATQGDYTLTQLGDVTLTSPTNGQVLKYNGTTWVNNTDTDTGLTSVGLSMPSAFAVANSPLTSNGTIAVTGAGTSAQYVRGDGQLANFPSTSGGGSSVNYYLNGSVNQGTFGGDTYYEMSKSPIAGAGTNFTRTSAQGNGYIASFITDANDPSLLVIPGGNWNLEFYFSASSGGGTPSFYAELYKVSSSNVFTLVASGSTNAEGITQGTVVDQYFTSIPVAQTSLLATDRLAVRIYVAPDGRNITLHTENSNLCEVLTTFSTGLNALNGLTAQVQYFATGTSGTDFAISSATDTHTFNLPTASATNRGALSSADWTLFNSKQDALTNPVTGTGTAGQVAFFSGTSAITGENNLFWNALYNRLGVNTNNPYLPVDIVADELGYNLSLRGEPSNAVAHIRFYSNDGLTPYSHIKSTDAEFLLGSIATNDVIFVSSGVEGIRITNTQQVKLSNIPQAVTDTNRFLVSDLGYIKYRTGAEILSDIGGQGLLTLTTTGTSGAATLVGSTLNIPQYQSVLTNPVTGTGTTNYLPKWTSGSAVGNSLIYENGNNIGIGTITPAYILDVNKSSFGTIAQFIFNDGTFNPRLLISGTSDGIELFATYSTSASNLMFGTGAVERIRITSGGNIGVGTISPEALLHINKSTSGGEGGYLYLDNPAASTLGNKVGIKFGTSTGASFASVPTGEITNIVTSAGDGASALTFGTFNGSSSGERMRLSALGNLLVGIIVDSGERLQVSGSGKFNDGLGVLGSSPAASTAINLVGTTASQRFLHIGSAAADSYIESASSTGGGLVTGADAYSLMFRNDIGFAFGLGSSIALKIASAGATFSSSVTATSFIKSGGTSSQYLMADGSVTTGGGGGVPYTGATANLNMGSFSVITNGNVFAQNYYSDGNGSTIGGFFGFKQYNTTAVGQSGYTSLYALQQNSLYIGYSQTSGGTKTVELSSALLSTTSRQYLFPDKSGTFALLSDISGGSVDELQVALICQVFG